MEMDAKSLRPLRRLQPGEADASIRRAVLGNPRGSSSEDIQSALEQVVDAGIQTRQAIDHVAES